MDICGHMIETNEIIGIGPLMVQPHPDPNMQALYNSKQLLFVVHVKQQSIKIESTWFNVGTSKEPGEREMHSRKRYQEFSDEYQLARNAIRNLLNEKSNQVTG